MNEPDFLAEQFEKNRSHLRAVAYRMLGSLSEADDAVQEAWLKLSRFDAGGIDNLADGSPPSSRASAWTCCAPATRDAKILSKSTWTRHPHPQQNRAHSIPNRRHCSLNPLASRCSSSSTRSIPPNASPLSSTISSPCPSKRSPPSSAVLPPRPVSSPAVHAAACRARTRCCRQPRLTAQGVSMLFSPLCAPATSTRSSPCSIPMSSSPPTLSLNPSRPCERSAGPRLGAGGDHRCTRRQRGAPALIEGTLGLVIAPQGRLFRVLRFTLADEKIVAIEVIGNPDRLRQLSSPSSHPKKQSGRNHPPAFA